MTRLQFMRLGRMQRSTRTTRWIYNMKRNGPLIFLLFGVLPITLADAGDLAKETYATLVSAQGEIRLPVNYRQNWSHLGSWLVNDPKAPGSGFHDVYTQPEAVNAFKKTGKFPDGAVLIKEIRAIGTGMRSTGSVQWAGNIAVWFVMVKDAKGRFKGNDHWGEGWGWALFEPDNPLINVSRGYVQNCLSCHLPAQQIDWVYLEGYPTLKP